jgi:anti-sigma B factor antagonist
MQDPLNVTSCDFEGGRVFALRGELDACTCPGLAETLSGPPCSLVVIDLSGLSFMDSSGLATIHAARQEAIKDAGALVVTRPVPIVQCVLKITGLDTWITDWNDEWPDVGARKTAP